MVVEDRNWQEKLLALRKHLKIAHHVPGRIRVRLQLSALPKLASLGLDEEILDQLPAHMKGIVDVRVNKPAGTAVINYRPEILAPSIWNVLLEGDDESVVALFNEPSDLG